jgi:hypothetical protein
MAGATGRSNSKHPLASASQATLVREVNERIRELAGTNGKEAWQFLCECGDSGCHRFLTLTLREYDGLRGAAAPISILAHPLASTRMRSDNGRGRAPA